MELRDYARVLRRHWILIFATTLIGHVAAWGFNAASASSYTSTTRLYVSVELTGGTAEEQISAATLAQQNAQSYANVVNTESVLAPVADQLGLARSTAELSGQVTATQLPNTALIDIAVTDGSAEQAAAIANAVGESFALTVQETLEGGGAANSTKITTVQPASAPTKPVGSKKKQNLAIGLFFGFFIGLAIAVIRGLSDRRLYTRHDLEEITDTPVLGVIPRTPDVRQNPLITQDELGHPRLEAVRALRTNIQHLASLTSAERSGSCFVFTSAHTTSGTTTTATNLAISLSTAGERVMLVDGDLRRSKVASYLDTASKPGLVEVLTGQSSLDEAIRPWGDEGLKVITAGAPTTGPAELLGSPAMRSFLADLRQRFEFVIIDSPALTGATDAAVLSRVADGAFIVAAAGMTTRPQLLSSLDAMRTAGVAPRGLIVTMAPISGPDRNSFAAPRPVRDEQH